MIKIINCGIGNYKTIASLLDALDREYQVINHIKEINYDDLYILPGIGSFDNLIRKLKENNFYDVLKKSDKDKLKIIGICLGAQALLNKSEEGIEQGLSLINGKVIRFKSNKVNVGWRCNNINIHNNIYNERYYFVHSYYMESKFSYLSSTFNDKVFSSVVKDKHKIAIQFHPERSGNDGIKFFEKMISLCE